MDPIALAVSAIFAFFMLWMVGRRLPKGRMLVGAVLGLAVCVGVLLLERTGLWPPGWR